MMPLNESVLYKIDDRDRILSVNAHWDRFAQANDAPDLIGSQIFGRSLWDFIADKETREIYRMLLNRVRAGRSVVFRLRCDSPCHRRLLEMELALLEQQAVLFRTRVIRAEEREVVPLLAHDSPRSGEIVRVCAWCSRINNSGSNWVEVEDAIGPAELFEVPLLPELSHTICPPCYDTMQRKMR